MTGWIVSLEGRGREVAFRELIVSERVSSEYSVSE